MGKDVMAELQTFSCPSCAAPLDIPRRVDETIRCPYCGTSVVVPESLRTERPTLTDELRDQARGHLRAGKKILAVTLLKDALRLSLTEARALVKEIEAGLPPGSLPKPTTPYLEKSEQAAQAVRLEIQALVAEGKTLQAVRRFSQAYRVGLRDAQHFVQQLEASLRDPHASPFVWPKAR